MNHSRASRTLTLSALPPELDRPNQQAVIGNRVNLVWANRISKAYVRSLIPLIVLIPLSRRGRFGRVGRTRLSKRVKGINGIKRIIVFIVVPFSTLGLL